MNPFDQTGADWILQGEALETIRRFGQSLDQQVQMVWHEAVRKNRELFVGCRELNLQQYQLHSRWTLEGALFRIATECQRISVKTDVIERPEVARSMSGHGYRKIKDRSTFEVG